jgi:hypothetical protein
MKQKGDLTRVCSLALILVWLAIGFDIPVCFNAPLGFHADAQANKDRSGSTSKSRAPAKKPIFPKTVDPCAVEDADANLTLGPGVPGVQAVSDGTKYYSADDYPYKAHCGLFVVDITVPSDSSAPGFLSSFSIESGAVDLKKANGQNMNNGTNYAGGFAVPNYNGCFVYHQETRIFARNSNANEFTLLSSVTARGSIDETTPYDPTKKCFLIPDPGKGVLSYGLPFGSLPAKSGTKVYRVAVKVSLGSVSNWGGENLQQVRVKASHDGDIK